MTLKPPERDDAARLWAWVGQPKTFEKFLDDWDDYVMEYAIARDTQRGMAAGCVRLVALADGAVRVDLFIDPAQRDRGLGQQLLDIVVSKSEKPLVAFVPHDNVAALRLFWAAGFGPSMIDGTHIVLRLEHQ